MFRVVSPPIIRSANDCIYSAPDDGWWYHLKHVEQFPDKINCVTLHLVGYTGCPRRNVPDFERVFLMLKYTDITQNTYVQS